MVYTSGLAFYHGSHGIVNIFTSLEGLKKISLEDDLDQLNFGDLNK